MYSHIEFMGTPGSGKSTLTNLVTRKLGEKKICVRRLDDAAKISFRRSLGKKYVRWVYNYFGPNVVKKVFATVFHGKDEFYINFCTENPELIAFLFDSYKRRRFLKEDVERDVRFIYQLVSKYQMCKGYLSASESVIIDEGFAYQPIRVLSSGDGSFCREYIKNYLAVTVKPNVIFRLRADLELCYKRIHERRGGPPPKLGKRGKEDAIRFLGLCDSYMNDIAFYLSQYGVKVIDVHTDEDIKTNQGVYEVVNDLANGLL